MKTTWLATLLILLLSVQWVDARMDAYAKHPTQPEALLSADEVLEHSSSHAQDEIIHHCCHCHGLGTLFTSAATHHSCLPKISNPVFPLASMTIANRFISPEHRPPIA